MKFLALILTLCPQIVFAYDLKNLSSADILTIGRGLDKLPREDTDDLHGGLYSRIQKQIMEFEQANVARIAAERKAEVDAAIKAAKDEN